MIGPVTAATLLGFLAPVVTVAQLLAMRVGPGGELGPIARNVEVLQVHELQVDRAGDKAGVEESLQGPLPDGEGSEVAVPLQDGGQRGRLEGTSQDAVRQAVEDVLMKPQVIFVFVLVSLVPLVTASVGPTLDGAGLSVSL